MANMKTVVINKRSKCHTLHVEAPGCIINIRVGLSREDGCRVTRIDVSADGDRYSGDPPSWIEMNETGHLGGDKTGASILVVQEPAIA